MQPLESATEAYVGLGANLGKAAQTLRAALNTLSSTPGIQALTASPLYRSAPIDSTGPDYINAVARLRTTLSPLALLTVLQDIENAHHRRRPYRNAPRTLDLDLLWMGGAVMDTPRLQLPHPRMHERAFVLRPLADLAPDFSLAQGDWPTLLARCADQPVERL